MNPSIPASAIVTVNPGVISAGGSALDMNGLLLTTNTRVPIERVLSFASAADVATFFGLSSDEAAAAAIYFAGFENSSLKPGAMLFYQYNPVAVSAYIRGGDISSMTLAELQALSGILSIVASGYTYPSNSFSLSSATGFSSAATLIQTAINTNAEAIATCTLGTIAATVLTVAGTVTGTFAVGQHITGSGVTANTIITSLGTGTGGAGTYNLSQSSTVGSAVTMTASAPALTVTYDSVSGAFVIVTQVLLSPSTIAFATGSLAASLKLTSATGAVLSQGADEATPAIAMAGAVAGSTNWATFATLFDPDGGSGNDLKYDFATWAGQSNNQYAYVAWDTDVVATESSDEPTCLGQLIAAAQLSGTILFYAPDADKAVFVMGAVASINFTQREGRTTLAFRSQSGLTADVTNQTVMNNLISNGYNSYGAFATRNDDFVYAYPGSISGQFLWADSFINQIWMNNALQQAMMVLLTNVRSIPYNNAGYAQVRAACTDPIVAALNFGAIRTGIPLSASQASQVNTAAGEDITSILFTQGFYLQILPATALTRGARQSPPMTLFYMDGQSIQKLNLASIEIQ